MGQFPGEGRQFYTWSGCNLARVTDGILIPKDPYLLLGGDQVQEKKRRPSVEYICPLYNITYMYVQRNFGSGFQMIF